MAAETPRKYAFIATLGLEPQVVTVVIDRLHEDYHLRFDEAVIIHTQPRPTQIGDRPDPIQASLDAVHQEMATYIRTGIVRADDYVPLRLPNGAPVYDIYSAQDARNVFRIIDEEVQRLRTANYNIHLSAAGGRKGMTMYAMAVAQFRFRSGRDRLWLLGSTPAFQATRQLHTASKDDAFIIPIPVAVPDESFEAELVRRGHIYRDLPPRLQQLLALVVTGGLGNDDIGDKLGVSTKRVEQLVRDLRNKLEQCMGTHFESHAFREQIIRIFSPYFQWRQLIDPLDEEIDSNRE